jgi:hypothetical protein
VPVLIHTGHDDVEVLALLLEANRQRQKSNEQIGREYEAAKEVETEQAKARQAQAAARTNARLGRGHDATLALTSTEPSSGKSDGTINGRADRGRADARDRAAERVGVGWQKGERAAAVVQAIKRLEERGKLDEATQLRHVLNESSVQRAYEQAMQAGHLEGPPAHAESRHSRRRSTSIDADVDPSYVDWVKRQQPDGDSASTAARPSLRPRDTRRRSADDVRVRRATVAHLLGTLRREPLEALLVFAMEEQLSAKTLLRFCREAWREQDQSQSRG